MKTFCYLSNFYTVSVIGNGVRYVYIQKNDKSQLLWLLSYIVLWLEAQFRKAQKGCLWTTIVCVTPKPRADGDEEDTAQTQPWMASSNAGRQGRYEKFVCQKTWKNQYLRGMSEECWEMPKKEEALKCSS